MIIHINNHWKYYKNFSEGILINSDSNGEEVRLPHNFVLLNSNYARYETYQRDSLYLKNIIYDDAWSNKRVFLIIEGAAHHSYVYLNGKLLNEHKCGYTPYETELTNDLLKGNNTLGIRVDSREKPEIPPFGGTVDYLAYSGLYREVSLSIRNKSYISDMYVHTQDDNLYSDIYIDNGLDYDIGFELFDDEKKIDCNIELIGKNRYRITIEGEVEKWGIDNPKLYSLKAIMYNNGEIIDEKTVRFGYRDIEFTEKGFFLNGEKIKIRGLNRHQSYPYVGYAMPKGAQIYDAKILKEELALNAVRTSHYPQSKHFIEACDELGLLVFTEIPGWQHIGDENWKQLSIVNVEDMVLNYRNHPSIIMWGVRINESKDSDEFYRKTNEVAKILDPYRPTGGVRCYDKSNLLEDVYTFNDFSYNGYNEGVRSRKSVTGKDKIAYIITEYNGHMYPTKPFDSESHLLNHALRHAKVVDTISKRDDISGGFGWCMSDYQTHVDFGGDDMICYHGVCDMFRNLKPAGYLYKSQGDDIPVLEIMPSMNLGENPESRLGEIYAFTNTDYVKLYINDEYINRFYPDKNKYKGLKHPPIEIDDIIGNKLDSEKYKSTAKESIKYLLLKYSKVGLSGFKIKDKIKAIKLMIFDGLNPMEFTRLYEKYIGNWGGERPDFRFVGCVDGKEATSVVKGSYKESHLEVNVENQKLVERETYDVALLRLRMLNQFNQIMRYYQEPIVLKTEGPLEIIGPKIISLKGGMGGTYIKTIGKEGKGRLNILEKDKIIESIEFSIEKEEVIKI